jgi:hexokinase
MRTPDLSPLRLNDACLEEVRSVLRERIERGLAEDGTEIKCLPAYLPPPPDGLEGQAIVLDTGGTNMRAALVTIEGTRATIDRGPIKQRLPVRDGQQLSRAAFFDAQAALVAELGAPRELPLGYCFSYPSDVQENRDARLIRWTKGIEVPSVAGELVGSLLRESLARIGIVPRRLAVLNDTVASMLGGAIEVAGPLRSRLVGLIAGTGSNMCAFFSPPRAKKLKYGPMAVNLESGNFDPPHLTEWDRALDRTTNNAGVHKFEKAIAGHYLPYLFAQVLPDLEGFDPAHGSKVLVDLRDQGGGPEGAQALAEALLARAADLVAAGLAAVCDFYQGDVAIVAEGSLFWGDPKFSDRCKRTLDRLSGKPAKILRVDEANLIGSACAALIP